MKTVLHNVEIITMNPKRSRFEKGLLVFEDSVITAVGHEADFGSLLKNFETGTEYINGQGMVLTPGLINTHTHIPMTLLRGVAEDVEFDQWWFQKIFPAEQKVLGSEYIKLSTKLGIMEMILSGTTTFNDMYFFADDIAQMVDLSGIRAVMSNGLMSFPAPGTGEWKNQKNYFEKFYSKWKSHPRITPIADAHSPYSVSSHHLKEVIQMAADRDVPLCMHIAENPHELDLTHKLNSAESKEYTSVIDYLEAQGLFEVPVIAVHSINLSESDMKKFSKYGVTVAHCPKSNMKLGEGIAKITEFLNYKIPVGLGTDGAASNNSQDLWDEINFVSKVQKVATRRPELLTADESFAMATCDAAKTLHLQNQIGSLCVGKKADMILINFNQPHLYPKFDTMSHLTHSVRGSDVHSVWVDGKQILKDRQFIHSDFFNFKQIMQEASPYIQSIKEQTSI